MPEIRPAKAIPVRDKTRRGSSLARRSPGPGLENSRAADERPLVRSELRQVRQSGRQIRGRGNVFGEDCLARGFQCRPRERLGLPLVSDRLNESELRCGNAGVPKVSDQLAADGRISSVPPKHFAVDPYEEIETVIGRVATPTVEVGIFDDQHPTGSDTLPHAAKENHRLSKVLEQGARVRNVVGSGFVPLGHIDLAKLHILDPAFCRFLPGHLKVQGVHVEASGRPIRTNEAGQTERHFTAPATQVDALHAGANSGPLEQRQGIRPTIPRKNEKTVVTGPAPPKHVLSRFRFRPNPPEELHFDRGVKAATNTIRPVSSASDASAAHHTPRTRFPAFLDSVSPEGNALREFGIPVTGSGLWADPSSTWFLAWS